MSSPPETPEKVKVKLPVYLYGCQWGCRNILTHSSTYEALLSTSIPQKFIPPDRPTSVTPDTWTKRFQMSSDKVIIGYPVAMQALVALPAVAGNILGFDPFARFILMSEMVTM